MKIHSTPNNGTIIIADSKSEKNSLFEDLSDESQTYLEKSKNALPKIQQDVLAREEKLKDIPADDEFSIKINHYRWWWIYIIKDSKLQEYWENLDKFIATFYSHVEKGMKSEAQEGQFTLIEHTIEQRKKMVTEAIIDTIHRYQIDKLIQEYDNGKTKYDCSPTEAISINRWEKTYASHIFNPIADINIVARIGSCSWWWKSLYDICISKDVFSPKNEIINDNNYLANLMGYKTKEELITNIKEWWKGLSEKWEKILLIAESIKKAKESN